MNKTGKNLCLSLFCNKTFQSRMTIDYLDVDGTVDSNVVEETVVRDGAVSVHKPSSQLCPGPHLVQAGPVFMMD